jgi:hypothetical protein
MAVTQSAWETLREMTQDTHQVAGILSEIQSASQEQSKAIREIGNMMDKLEAVTQDNNANAKQTSNAAEDMATQALGLKGMVTQLVSIVEGGKSTTHPQGLNPPVVAYPKPVESSRTSWAGWFGKKKPRVQEAPKTPVPVAKLQTASFR